MKPEEFGEHITITHRNHLLHHEEDDVDEEEIAGDGRDIFEHKRGVSAVLKLGQVMTERYSEGMDKKAANKKMKDIRKLYIQLRVYLQLRVVLFWSNNRLGLNSTLLLLYFLDFQ